MQTFPTPLSSARPSPPDCLPLPQQLGYALGSAVDMWGHWLYPILAFPVFNIFLGVSPWLVSLALMFARIFDAVCDPFFGWLSDNARSRFGRRRPFILAGALAGGIGLPLLFRVSPAWSEGRIVAFMLVSSFLYVPGMCCFNLPYQSLGSELTPSYHERTRVMVYRNGIQQVMILGLCFGPQFVTLSWFADPRTGAPNLLRGAQWYTLGLGALMVAAGFAVAGLVRERYYPSVLARGQARLSLSDTLWNALRCPPFRRLLVITLGFAIGTSMTTTLSFYDTAYYVCRGDLAAAGRWNTLMGVAGSALGLIGVVGFGRLARRRGKRTTMALALAAGAAAFSGTWWLYDPRAPWLLLGAAGLVSLSTAAFWTLLGSMNADVVDADELLTGQRREGAFAACSSWIMKCGLALGAGGTGILLSWAGFDAKLGGGQSVHTLTLMRLMVAGVPLAGIAVSTFGLGGFSLSQSRMAAIRAQLELRRGLV